MWNSNCGGKIEKNFTSMKTCHGITTWLTWSPPFTLVAHSSATCLAEKALPSFSTLPDLVIFILGFFALLFTAANASPVGTVVHGIFRSAKIRKNTVNFLPSNRPSKSKLRIFLFKKLTFHFLNPSVLVDLSTWRDCKSLSLPATGLFYLHQGSEICKEEEAWAILGRLQWRWLYNRSGWFVVEQRPWGTPSSGKSRFLGSSPV